MLPFNRFNDHFPAGIVRGERGARPVRAAGAVSDGGTTMPWVVRDAPFWSRMGYRPLWTGWEVRPAISLR